MVTTIVLKGDNWNNLKNTYQFFKDEKHVLKQFSNGFLLVFKGRKDAHSCMNKARRDIIKQKLPFAFKRYNYLIYNGCKAEINL